MIVTIEALREGNQQVFERLFENSYSPLCRYAYSILHDMNEAEDIVQKVFCKLWDQRKTIDIRTSISSYMYRIVHNDSLNKIQQQQNRQTHNLIYMSELTDTDNSLEESIESNELQKAIDVALEKLPPQCKRVFEMSRNEFMSYSEISSLLGISINTVENHISKALKIMRFELREFLTIYLFYLLQ